MSDKDRSKLIEAIEKHFEYWDIESMNIGESVDLTIVAMSSLDNGDEGFDGEELKELARARVRLSLNCERIGAVEYPKEGE